MKPMSKRTNYQQMNNNLHQQLYRQMLIPLFIIGLACSLLLYKKISESIIDSNVYSIEFTLQNDALITNHYQNGIEVNVWCETDDISDCDIEIQNKPNSNLVHH